MCGFKIICEQKNVKRSWPCPGFPLFGSPESKAHMGAYSIPMLRRPSLSFTLFNHLLL